MKFETTINNYTLGSTFKCTPYHKVVKQERKNRWLTVVAYEGLTKWEVELCRKAFGRRGKTEIEPGDPSEWEVIV